MSSVSATELAKLGKCEAAISVGSTTGGWRGGRRNSTDRNHNSEDSESALRGKVAHDEFEREARAFSGQVQARNSDELKAKKANIVIITASVVAAISIIASLIYTATLR